MWETCAGHIERGEQLVIPFAAFDVEEQRTAGVGRVSRVNAAAGELPYQPRVDGPKGQAGLPLARSRAPGTLSSSQRTFVPEKYASSTRPVRC